MDQFKFDKRLISGITHVMILGAPAFSRQKHFTTNQLRQGHCPNYAFN